MSGSAAEMRASLLLTLEDRFSGGMERLTASLDKLTGTIDKLNLGSTFDGIGTRIEGAAEKLGLFERKLSSLGGTAKTVGAHIDAALGKLASFTGEIGPMGGAIAGAVIVEPVRVAADYDNVLRQIAITEHLSGAAAETEIKRLGDLFAADAQRTGQASAKIAEAYLDFVTTGLTPQATDAVIGQHSQAATAYNIAPETLGPAVIALLNNLHIAEADIGSTIAAMAEAAKSGRFKVSDFAAELPAVTSMMQAFGMTGRKGADFGFAALETAMKGEGLPSSAAAGVVDALNYLTGQMANRGFAKAGVDLPALLREGEKAGKNPLDSVLDRLEQMTKGQSPVQLSETLHGLLHNLQAEKAVLALLQHRDELKALNDRLGQVDATKFATDFQTAFAGPITQVRLFNENLAQATRTLGEQFTPAVAGLNVGLHGLTDVLNGAIANFPILTGALGIATTALLGLAAAAGAKSLVGPFVERGAALLVAGLGGAAGASVAGGALVAAEFANFLRQEREKAWSNPVMQNPARQSLDIHVTADPGLDVHVGGRPGGADFTPLRPDPSVLATGRD